MSLQLYFSIGWLYAYPGPGILFSLLFCMYDLIYIFIAHISVITYADSNKLLMYICSRYIYIWARLTKTV